MVPQEIIQLPVTFPREQLMQTIVRGRMELTGSLLWASYILADMYVEDEFAHQDMLF